MNEIVTESSHAQCELCGKMKTVRMIQQSANNKRRHRLLSEVLPFRKCLARLGLLSHYT